MSTHLENLPGVQARIDSLRGKLKARDKKKEFKENCVALRAEIERLEKQRDEMLKAQNADL